MMASFLGVTAHCFSEYDNKKHSFTLAVKEFSPPHTAARVAASFEAVLKKWNLPAWKIFRILTDNGSNMVAAFKEHEVESSQADNEASDESDDEILLLDEDCKEPLDDDCEDDSTTNTRLTIESEVNDFELAEESHQTVFDSYRRLSCFIHTLQLVVNSNVLGCIPTVSKARRIVSKVNKSCVLTKSVIKKAGKKLVSDVPTRWNSTFLMIDRLLQVREDLCDILEEHALENLTQSQWNKLESIHTLLQPFNHYTNTTSSEATTTIAMVIPVLMELTLHLEEVNMKVL